MAREIDRDFIPPNTGAEEIPPGATRKAFDREEMPGDGEPGSGGGSCHMAGDANDQWDTGVVEGVDPEIDPSGIDEDDGPGYGGPHGGAVGGTPAGKRASGGRVGRGIKPEGDHRGDSTIGTDPDSGTD
jgi:hypothetical protein